MTSIPPHAGQRIRLSGQPPSCFFPPRLGPERGQVLKLLVVVVKTRGSVTGFG
jgi:hypothetical protein